MKYFMILVFFAVLLNPLVFAAEVEGNPDLQLVPEDNRFAPGDVGRFTFSIINNGEVDTAGPQNLEDQVMSAEGLTYTVGGDGNASANIRRDISAVGTVPDGLFQEKMGFQIAIDEDASSGMYSVPVNLSYRYKDSIEYNASSGAVESYDYDDRFVQEDMILRIDETAELELVDSSFSGSVGDSGTLTMDVLNVGNDSVEDVSFTVSSKNPDLSFGQGSSSERFSDVWSEGEMKSFEFKASISESALKSEMTVQASASFTDDGYPGSDSFSFGLGVPGENKFSVEDVDASLRKGSSDRVSGTVVNEADRVLEDVEVVFNPSDPYLTVKQSSYSVGTLEEEGSANFSFPVEVSSSAEPGPRLYSVSGRYSNPEGDVRSMNSVNFEAEIEDSEGSFSVDVFNSSVESGEGGKISLRVVNPSGSLYENVDAKIFTSDPLSSSDDRAFTSELRPGESEVLEFKVSAGASALEKSYPINMDFRYEVDGESKMSETYRVPVEVESVEEQNSSIVPLALVALLLVLGVSYYLKRPEKIWGRVSGE